MGESSNGGMLPTVTAVIALLLVALVGWNIYTGATVQKIGIPGVFEIEFGPQTTSAPPDTPPVTRTSVSPETPPVTTTTVPPSVSPVPLIAGKYLMDGNPGRVIVISSDGKNSYTIGEPTSPWPWSGTIMLNGDEVVGQAWATSSKATFTLDGEVLKDRRIAIAYRFITDTTGADSRGRVDNHVLVPVA